jgi:PBP1b-binding outer membrane lipoprotein LpoB
MMKRLLLWALLAAMLVGCASDPRYKQGLEWVQWNEQEKKRLNAQGFPQYNWY